MKRLYKLLVLAAILFWGLNSYATIYYVSSSIGLTSHTKLKARNIATPWAKIQTGLDSAAVGDTVWVLPGTYTDPDTVRKSLFLLGNGGFGTKPIIVPPLRQGALSCITVRARNVTIRNFQLEFNQIFCVHGINADGGGVWSGLVVTDCRILSKGTGAPCIVFNSYGIYARGNQDSLTAQRNWIGSPNVMVNCVPGRGIWTNNIRALIGGPTPADSNVLQGYYGIQSATNPGNWRVMNNKLYGIGFLFNAPNTVGATHQIIGNQFFGLTGLQVIAQLELRSCQDLRSKVIIKGNTFSNFATVGIFAGRCRNVFIDSNSFYPASPDAIAIGLNTKFQTTGVINQPMGNSAYVIGNRFFNLPNNDIGSTAVGVYNHNAVARDTSFKFVVIGGAGRDANRFGNRIAFPILLDSNSRQSVAYPLWGGFPITNMNPVKVSINATENLFELANNVYKRPALMTEAELFMIESKIKHRTHDARLGFVRTKANMVFVSRRSFSQTANVAPSLNRGLLSAADGDTVLVQPDTLSGETITNPVSATIRGRAGRLLVWNGINMGTIGKTLTLASNVKLNTSISLNNGVIDIGNKTLLLNRGLNFFGGSASSHIRVAGGKFQRLNFVADSIVAPLAIGNNYSRLSIAQSGGIRFDTLTLSLAQRALTADYSPALPSVITSHAGLQWTARNSSQIDNLDATVRVTWPASSEVNGPLQNRTRLYAFNGVGWKRFSVLYGNNSATVTGVNSVGDYAVVSDPRQFVLATGVNSRFLCSGRDSLDVQALSTDTFRFPNTFTYQLSDPAGSFASPIALGTFDSRLAATKRFPIPTGLPFGNNYRVRVLASNPAIVGDSSLTTISIDSVPGVPSITLSGPTSFCLGDSLVLTAPLGYAQYTWSTGETTSSIVVKRAGNYSVIVTNAGRCQSPISQTVDVVVTSFSALPTITLISGANTFCQGDSVVLAGPAGFGFYLWSNGATTQQITVSSSGIYNLRVGQVSNCLSDTATTPEVVTVTPKPARPTFIQFGNRGDTLFATAGGQRYEWYLNGTRIAGTTSILRITRGGNYTVVMVRNGCKSDTSIIQLITALSTPLSASSINLYPNPASNSVQLELNGSDVQSATINLLDAVGRLHRTYTITNKDNTLGGELSLTGIRPGIYLIQTVVNGQRITKRLTVE